MPPNDHPAAPCSWHGRQLENDSSWRIGLSHLAARGLAEAAVSQRGRALRDVVLPAADAELLDQVTQRSTQALDAQTGQGFTVVSGVPVTGLDDEAVTRVYWLMGSKLGLPVTQSAAADLVGHVRQDLSASVHRGYKSSAHLGFHSDMTPLAGLLCNRQAPHGGESTLVDAAYVHNVMRQERPDLLDICYQDFPFGRLDENRPDEPPYLPQPIFAQDARGFGCFYGRPLITQAVAAGAGELTDSQIEALDCLDEISNRPGVAFNFILLPGELLWLNNYRVFHGRSSFEDHPDASLRRHLLRLWLDLPEAEITAPSTVRYPFHYGNIGYTATDADMLTGHRQSD